MLIEVDITKSLPSIVIRYSNEKGTIIEQKVTYDWVPPFFTRCQTIGHNYQKSSTKPRYVIQKQVVKQSQERKELPPSLPCSLVVSSLVHVITEQQSPSKHASIGNPNIPSFILEENLLIKLLMG